MRNTFLQDLNNAQKQAVENYKGPSLIIAGAGSGKTRVLTYRIAYLLNNGINPQDILALTFTNKAAKEMKERIALMVGESIAQKLWMGTFHSIFSRILRKESEALGYPATYTIYDSQDSKNVIKQIIKELQLDDQIYKTNDVLNRISQAKNNLVTAQAYKANSQLITNDTIGKKPLIHEIYAIYTKRNKQAGAMDFDDLLLNTNILFRDRPDILDIYQQKFKYILVDEYQDTNFSQYLILKKLALQHHNLCVVGDDAQSIYSFRGAKIENILNFKKDYPNCQIYKLEQNYRSTQTIVNAANSLIAHNIGQIKKTVFSKNQVGHPIKIARTQTDQEEGFYVADQIRALRFQQHDFYRDYAVLYRTNAQSRIFEEVFRKRNIPYKLIGSTSFYQRKEIKDMVAYLRIISNHDDDEAFKRVLNYPPRGIGDTTLSHLVNAGTNHNSSLWTIANDLDKYAPMVKSAGQAKIKKFIDFVTELTDVAKEGTILEIGQAIIFGTQIIEHLKSENVPENISRIDNIDALLNGMRDFTDNASEDEPATLSNYLQNIALLSDNDQETENEEDKVTLMTIHASKGLEFKNVFIVGLEEMLFPGQMSYNSVAELEEERRLFYVALTRAMENVQLTYADMRYKWGSPTNCTPSRFLKEIDTEYVEEYDSNASITIKRTSNSYRSQPTFNRIVPKPNLTPLSKSKTNYSSSTSNYGNIGFVAVNIGDNVIHDRFGKGIVQMVEGNGPDTKATVEFEQCGKKVLLLKFAKLKRI